MENTYCIYCHTSPSNKKYIGQTSMQDIPEKRWGYQGKGYQGNPHFWSAIQKYGWDNFIHEIIEDNLTLDEANEKEEYYIMLYETLDSSKGYNLRHGGSHGKFSDEARLHMCEAQQKIAETKIVWNKGKTGIYSEETLKKMSETRKSNFQSGKNISWNKGKTDVYSKETREKISNTKKRHLAEGLYTSWAKGLIGVHEGEKNPNYGKKHPGELHWFNNRIENKRASQCSDGFVPGRLSYKKKPSGKHWYNNGTVNVFALECPSGFVPGALQNHNRNRAPGNNETAYIDNWGGDIICHFE